MSLVVTVLEKKLSASCFVTSLASQHLLPIFLFYILVALVLKIGCISGSHHRHTFEMHLKHWTWLSHGGMGNTYDLGSNLYTEL